MRAKSVLAALFALVSFQAVAANDCIGIPVQAGFNAVETAGGENLIFLTGDAQNRAVALYNSIPPEDDEEWSVALLADLPGGAGFLAVGRGSVFCGRIIIPAEHYKAVKRSILGTAA